MEAIQQKSVIDLASFFMDLACNPESKENKANQFDQIMIVTHFYQTVEGKPCVIVGDYNIAYEALQSIPVSKPANLSARLSDLVGKKLLYKKDAGYALTEQGKKHLQEFKHQ